MADYLRGQKRELELPLRLSLVAPPAQRGTALTNDSRLVNGYADLTEDNELHVVKRPGFTLAYTLTGGANLTASGAYDIYHFWTQNLFPGSAGLMYRSNTLVATLYSEAATLTYNYWASYVQSGTRSRVLLVHNTRGANVYNPNTGVAVVLTLADNPFGPLTGAVNTGSPVVTVASTAGLQKYSTPSASGGAFATSDFVQSIDSATQFTMSANSAITNAAQAITFNSSGPNGTRPYVDTSKRLLPGVGDLNSRAHLCNEISQLQSADPGDPTAWDPLSFLFAYDRQQTPIAIARHLTFVLAFKTNSIEFFRDAGQTPGSPLLRVDNRKLDIGLASATALCELDGALFWISTTDSKRYSAHMLEKGELKECASPSIARLFSGNTPTVVYGFTYSGHTFFVCTSVTGGYSAVYDKQLGLWYFWQALGQTYLPFRATCFDSVDGEVMFQSFSGGTLYKLNKTASSDAGAGFDMDIYAPEFDAGTRLTKYLSKMYVVADQIPGSTLSLRVSDDNQQTWSDYRTFNLAYDRPRLDECGSFYKRFFHFRHSGTQLCRIRGVELDLLPGTL
jgi:hypothetical protein